MKEGEYINATNYARLIAIKALLGDLTESKVLSLTSIQSFAKWVSRMEIKHSQAMRLVGDEEE